MGKKRPAGYHVLDSRKYDHVADILTRIEAKLSRGDQNRKANISARVERLSRSNSHVELMNKSWNENWAERDKQSLVNNASKAKLIDQKRRKLAIGARGNLEFKSEKNLQRLERFKQSHSHARQNFEDFQTKVMVKHQQQTENTQTLKGMVEKLTKQKREENMLRHYDANTNKFKEDVKYDNFKKHVIGKHTRQAMQVKERQIRQQLIRNLNQSNNTYIIRQNSLQAQYRAFVCGRRNFGYDVE